MRGEFCLDKSCCVILAAGEGKRMKSSIPKVLSPVLFEPMVGWVINSVINSKINDICVVTGYRHELVEDYVSKLNYNLETVIQKERKGTGHAVMTALSFLEKHAGGDALILGGDAPFVDKKTITKAYKAHKNSNNSATIISSRLENPVGYGRIVRDSDDYNVKAIVEESDASFGQRSIKEINSGAYWFKVDDLIKYLSLITNDTFQGEYYLTSIIKLMIDAGLRVDAFETSSCNVALGANDVCQLQHLNDIARNKVIDGMMENGVKIPCRDGVIIGKWVEVGSGTTILPGTILSGKTTIGKECIIGPNSQIIDSAVGDSAVVNQSYCKKVNIKSGEEIGPFASLKS